MKKIKQLFCNHRWVATGWRKFVKDDYVEVAPGEYSSVKRYTQNYVCIKCDKVKTESYWNFSNLEFFK